MTNGNGDEASLESTFLRRVNWILLGSLVLIAPVLAVIRWLVVAPQSGEPQCKNQAARAPVEFELAIEQARYPRSTDVIQNLLALVPTTTELRWSPNASAVDAKVLVAVWSDYRGYPKNLKRGCRLEREVWVTPVPQLQHACRAYGLKGGQLEERLGKYLGLPPRLRYDSVAELWVNPKDVFRPCPDREVTDSQCRTGLPELPGQTGESDLAHARWFMDQLKERYFTDKPFPWTRLGYTYDWGSQTNHVGASEYVIRKAATVWVASVTETGRYCSAGAEPERAVAEDKEASDGC